MYIFYLKYIVELLRAPLYNFFFYIIFFPGISKKKYARRRLPKIKITVPLPYSYKLSTVLMYRIFLEVRLFFTVEHFYEYGNV